MLQLKLTATIVLRNIREISQVCELRQQTTVRRWETRIAQDQRLKCVSKSQQTGRIRFQVAVLENQMLQRLMLDGLQKSETSPWSCKRSRVKQLQDSRNFRMGARHFLRETATVSSDKVDSFSVRGIFKSRACLLLRMHRRQTRCSGCIC